MKKFDFLEYGIHFHFRSLETTRKKHSFFEEENGFEIKGKLNENKVYSFTLTLINLNS